MLYSELRYLVGYEKQPHLRVGVKPGNILNWVSPRAFEEYHSNKYEAAERARVESELPLIEAKEERKRKRIEKLSRAGVPTKTHSRKRKRTPIDVNEVAFKGGKAATYGSSKKVGGSPGPGRRHQPVEEEVSFTSPKQSQHSQQQPSLCAGGIANRTILDSDSEDEDSMTTETQLEYQLKGDRLPPSNIQTSRSTSTSPPLSSKRNTRSRSASKPIDTSREESPSISEPTSSQRRRTRHLPTTILSGKTAVAATSSREALKVYEDLERKNRKPQTIADKYSYTRRNSQSQTFKGAHVGLDRARGLAQVAAEDEETDEPEEEAEEEAEPEYEVKCILDDKIMLGKDNMEEVWYLIKWVGEWEDTWEPAENVGPGAIQEYEREKRRRKGSGRERGGTGDRNRAEESDEDSLFASERKGSGKGKEVMRGQVIDDYDDDSEDDECRECLGLR